MNNGGRFFCNWQVARSSPVTKLTAQDEAVPRSSQSHRDERALCQRLAGRWPGAQGDDGSTKMRVPRVRILGPGRPQFSLSGMEKLIRGRVAPVPMTIHYDVDGAQACPERSRRGPSHLGTGLECSHPIPTDGRLFCRTPSIRPWLPRSRMKATRIRYPSERCSHSPPVTADTDSPAVSAHTRSVRNGVS